MRATMTGGAQNQDSVDERAPSATRQAGESTISCNVMMFNVKRRLNRGLRDGNCLLWGGVLKRAKADAQNSWARGRQLKVAGLSLIIAISGGAITTALAIAVAKPNASAANGLPELVDKYPWVAVLQHLQIVGPWVAAHPLAAAAIFGCLGGLGGAWGIAGNLHDRFFAAFNSDVFKPVIPSYRPDREPRNKAFVVLPWLPGTGARAAAWKALRAWLQEDQTQREGFWLFSKPVHPLTMTVLTGRAGSGKSRMAYELARTISGAAEEQPPSALSRLNNWARFTFAPRLLDDQSRWDAGLLPPSALAVGRDRGLAEWRPRRPTLILLDDPGPGQTLQVWSTLQANAPTFRHAVRLLVSNQSVPYDSGFAFSDTIKDSGGWAFQGSPAATPPIVLPVEAWFTESEVRMLARRADMVRLAAAAHSEVGKSLHANLFRVTRGNPLLVQLAFEWVRDKKSFEDVSADALSEARVERIFAALRLNGINNRDQFTALALATLTGGLRRDTLADLGLDELPSNDELQACFPSDDMRLGEFPPIRPEMIADRFVDRVIQQFSIPPELLIKNGFNLAPSAMLRVLRRARPVTSQLGAALIEMEPRTIEGLDAVHYTLALAELAAVCRHDEWPRTTEADRRTNLARAQNAIAALSPQEREAFRQEFFALLKGTAGVDPLATIRIEPALSLLTGSIDNVGALDLAALSDELRLAGDWLLGQPTLIGATLFEASDAISHLTTKLDDLFRSEGATLDPEIALDAIQRIALLDLSQGIRLLHSILTNSNLKHDSVDSRLIVFLEDHGPWRKSLFPLLNRLIEEGLFQTHGVSNAIIAASCVFVLLGKVGDFQENSEEHGVYRKWAEWASGNLRRASNAIKGSTGLRLLQLVLLQEARFWSHFRTTNGFTSSIDSSDEQVERVWPMLVSAFELAQRLRHQPGFDIVLFSESVANLATIGARSKPLLSNAFRAIFDVANSKSPKRYLVYLGRIQLSEIYSNCAMGDSEECLVRFHNSIFHKNIQYFEGFHELELEACRLTHIKACENPEYHLFAISLEGRMRKIIDSYTTEISEHANVWARLE